MNIHSNSSVAEKSSGKHMICDIKEIKNHSFLNNIDLLKNFLDELCEKYNYTILTKSEHKFSPQGITILYMLSESHISIHTFPEHNYAAMDIYTCRYYENNEVYNKIYGEIIGAFDALYETPIIIDRIYGAQKST